MTSCVVVFDGQVTTVVYDDITTCTSGCWDPAWNLVKPRSWCWKIHFKTKKQSQKWEGWSFAYFSVRWNWIIHCQQIVACPSSKLFVKAL